MEKSTIIGAATGLAWALVIGTVAVANAGTTPTPTPSQSGYAMPGGDHDGGDHGQGRGGAHTDATAAETASVTAAVTAKDSAITVTKVEKDADGSFDVRGTKAGAEVMVEVSKDLTTVEVRTGGDGRGKGGRKMGTPVDAATLVTLQDAVKAKDSAVTLFMGMKAADGSYRAMGSKGTDRVMVELSADLKTVTVTVGGRGGHGHGAHGRGGHGDDQQGPGAPSQSPTGIPSATATGASYRA